MGKSSFFGDGNIHRESTLVLYSASTRLTDGGRIMVNRPLSSRQVKKEKLRHEGLVPVSKGSQAL